MRSLLDVNVLIALLDDQHMHHHHARTWWKSARRAGWASCAVTINGVVRILSQPRYPNSINPALAIEALDQFAANSDHEFWTDAISLTDHATVDRDKILGPNQITDIYLLALAVRNGGRLATLDLKVAPAAVRGAKPEHLLTL